MAQDSLIEPFMIEMSSILNGKRPPSERKGDKIAQNEASRFIR